MKKIQKFLQFQIDFLIKKSWWPQIIKDSNRTDHFVYGFYCALILTILFNLGIATGLEVKDYLRGAGFDKLDWLATVAGGVLGQMIQALVIILFVILL